LKGKETARLVVTTGSVVYLVGGVHGWMPDTTRDFAGAAVYPIDVLGVRITDDEAVVEDELVKGGGEKEFVDSLSTSEWSS